MTYVYFNPLRHADVSPGRVDDGVDYHVRGGWLASIGECVMTANYPGGWGKYGNYCEYKLLAGPLSGMHVYYAEGIRSAQSVGRHFAGDAGICQLIPGWPYGIEIGWAAGSGARSWASVYGGGHHRTEQTSTQAGISFNRLLGVLGAPMGYVYHDVMGTAPNLSYRDIVSSTDPRAGDRGGGGGVHLPTTTTGDISDYDSGPIIRESTYWLGVHGYRADHNTRAMLDMLARTKVVTTGGPQ